MSDRAKRVIDYLEWNCGWECGADTVECRDCRKVSESSDSYCSNCGARIKKSWKAAAEKAVISDVENALAYAIDGELYK